MDGRWFGRGTADCKGNIVMHLAALRALGEDAPVNLKLVVEGSEEQGTGGLEAFVPENADLLRADTILVCDTGNAAGMPHLHFEVHLENGSIYGPDNVDPSTWLAENASKPSQSV